MNTTTNNGDSERLLALGQGYDAAMHALYEARAILNSILAGEILDHLPIKGQDAQQVEDVVILLMMARDAVMKGLDDAELPKADQ